MPTSLARQRVGRQVEFQKKKTARKEHVRFRDNTRKRQANEKIKFCSDFRRDIGDTGYQTHPPSSVNERRKRLTTANRGACISHENGTKERIQEKTNGRYPLIIIPFEFSFHFLLTETNDTAKEEDNDEPTTRGECNDDNEFNEFNPITNI